MINRLDRIKNRFEVLGHIAESLSERVPISDHEGNGQVIFCGSFLDVMNNSPKDIDVAIVLPFGHKCSGWSSRLTKMFPNSRVSYGSSYRKIETREQEIHFWILEAKDVLANFRIRRTLLSGREYDKDSTNLIKPRLASALG